ncbi:MAG: cobalamin-dependent protein [Casimicrobiaceae bacterium]
MDTLQRVAMTADGIQSMRRARESAVQQAAELFYAKHGKAYERFGDAGRKACRDDLAFHLDFMEPALEYGRPEPFLAYLRWLRSVLRSRGVPADHLLFSLQLLVDALAPTLAPADRDALDALVGRAGQALLQPECVFADLGERAGTAATGMCDALLKGDRRTALSLLQGDIAAGGSYSDAQVRLVQAAMYDVGARWQLNRVSVAQEHLATATAQTVITQSLVSQPAAEARRESVILACVEGNHHALGLRMVADAFELAGWRVTYLGANTPARFLCEMARESRPSVIGLSTALPQHLRAARTTIVALRATFGDACPRILLGGLAVNLLPGIATVLGADAALRDAAECSDYASAEAA